MLQPINKVDLSRPWVCLTRVITCGVVLAKGRHAHGNYLDQPDSEARISGLRQCDLSLEGVEVEAVGDFDAMVGRTPVMLLFKPD